MKVKCSKWAGHMDIEILSRVLGFNYEIFNQSSEQIIESMTKNYNGWDLQINLLWTRHDKYDHYEYPTQERNLDKEIRFMLEESEPLSCDYDYPLPPPAPERESEQENIRKRSGSNEGPKERRGIVFANMFRRRIRPYHRSIEKSTPTERKTAETDLKELVENFVNKIATIPNATIQRSVIDDNDI